MTPQELARSKGQAVSSDREDKYLTFSLAGVPGGIKGLVKARDDAPLGPRYDIQ